MNFVALHSALQRLPLPTHVEEIIVAANNLDEALEKHPELIGECRADLKTKLQKLVK